MSDVTENILWLFTFLVLYWTYCIAWGVRSGRAASSATDYFLSNRRLAPWIFVLAATAASFSGWIFLGHPGLIYRDGFPYAFISLCAVTIPLAGVLFMKRQWMLGRRFGYVTQGELLAHYFDGQGIRWLVALVALTFAVPFVGLQLQMAGYLVAVLSNGVIDQSIASWILAVPLIVYVSLGGLRSVAFVGTLQCLLLLAGIFTVGIVAYAYVGGFNSLVNALGELASSNVGPWGTTGEGESAYTAIPGVIQFTAGLGEETPYGGIWTGVMILSMLLAFMGVQASPTFSMWSFAVRSPRAFGIQQVIFAGGVVGFLLVVFSTAQGTAAHFLGAPPSVDGAAVNTIGVLPTIAYESRLELVPSYIRVLGHSAPWFLGLLAVCFIAALQSTAAAHLNATAVVLTRDIYLPYFKPIADDQQQKRTARILTGVLILAALLLATFSMEALVVLGGLALAFSFQLLPALASACWFPWITRQGATTGLAFGLIAVVMTENLGIVSAGFFGLDLPWGRWPWTIHSAVWGMFFNLLSCAIVSALSYNEDGRSHRQHFHDFLSEHDSLPREKRVLRPVAWSAVLLWLFFAAGPGAVLGNDFFGVPGDGPDGWNFGIPSIWAWLIIGWACGVLVLWFLAYRLEMATAHHVSFEPLSNDIARDGPRTIGLRRAISEPKWYWSFAAGTVIIVTIQWIFGG